MPPLEQSGGLLEYEPETGIFRWRSNHPGGVKAGDIAGCLDTDGYRVIRIGRRNYRASRLAWYMHHGVVPDRRIDHKNRIRSDDRIDNLRLALPGQNDANQRLYKDNKSGHMGVICIPHCRHRPWRAFIQHKHVGAYATLAAAVEARRKAEVKQYGAFAPHLN
jgi:hypothetical protein